MKFSELNKLLNGNLSGKQLQAINQSEVLEYARLLEKKGASIPLNILEDEEIYLTDLKIKKLLGETLIGNLTNIHLAFLCDCLTMSENIHFQNAKVEDIVFGIADPEINGSFKSDAEIEEILAKL